MDSPNDTSMQTTNIQPRQEAPTNKSFFVEDLTVAEISDIVRHQVIQDPQLPNEDRNNDTVPRTSHANISLEVPIAQRLCINLIRHRFARNTDMTALKLFKSFITTLRKVDKNIAVLPYDSMKQQYTSLVSSKQVETLNEHQLKLYFQPWHREQYYSMSGFIHISSVCSYDELFRQAPHN